MACKESESSNLIEYHTPISRCYLYSRPKLLAMKVPSIVKLEKIEGIYPNPRFAKDKISFKSIIVFDARLGDTS